MANEIGKWVQVHGGMPGEMRLDGLVNDVRFYKRSKNHWYVSINGVEYALPKRATFGHAEAIVKRELGL
jgi:hypothetical protein